MSPQAASSPARNKLLARDLWMAMIAGPDMVEEAWRAFKKQENLDNDSLRLVQQLYSEQMRPVVSETQLAALRRRYQAFQQT